MPSEEKGWLKEKGTRASSVCVQGWSCGRKTFLLVRGEQAETNGAANGKQEGSVRGLSLKGEWRTDWRILSWRWQPARSGSQEGGRHLALGECPPRASRRACPSRARSRPSLLPARGVRERICQPCAESTLHKILCQFFCLASGKTDTRGGNAVARPDITIQKRGIDSNAARKRSATLRGTAARVRRQVLGACPSSMRAHHKQGKANAGRAAQRACVAEVERAPGDHGVPLLPSFEIQFKSRYFFKIVPIRLSVFGLSHWTRCQITATARDPLQSKYQHKDLIVRGGFNAPQFNDCLRTPLPGVPGRSARERRGRSAADGIVRAPLPRLRSLPRSFPLRRRHTTVPSPSSPSPCQRVRGPGRLSPSVPWFGSRAAHRPTGVLDGAAARIPRDYALLDRYTPSASMPHRRIVRRDACGRLARRRGQGWRAHRVPRVLDARHPFAPRQDLPKVCTRPVPVRASHGEPRTYLPAGLASTTASR